MFSVSSSEALRKFFDDLAPQRDRLIAKNTYYYQELYKLHQWLVEKNKSVLDIGCGTGDLLKAVKPKNGVGIDFSHEMVKIASRKYPQLSFQVMDAHFLEFQTPFDYIIMSNLVGYLDDVWQVFNELRKVSHEKTRIIITNYNYWWQPLFSLAEKLKIKMPDRVQNWLPQRFIEHFLVLTGFEVVKKGKFLHLPVKIPYLSSLINSLFANIPLISSLGLIEYIVARPAFFPIREMKDVSTSVIVPTHEEVGNIQTIVERMKVIGKSTELIFVDLPGNDGTGKKIRQQTRDYKGPIKIKYLRQRKKTGKIGALRQGVKKASGEIILIYDADVTIPPEDLQKFYQALLERKADLVNGTRLVYPTEKGAMRFFNHIGNMFFAIIFSWALGQHFTDTFCGSKGFWKKDFDHFEKTKVPFDKIDKYGDFYLLLGAYRRNLKIAEIPVRYKTRRYGDTKLNRLRNGWEFLKMFIYFFWYYKILRKN